MSGTTKRPDEEFRQRLPYWLPALTAGALAWFIFLFPGETPLLRASGMALVIVAMALLLRRFGSALALCGSLVLAFSPAFWTQTGGVASQELTSVLAVLALIALATLLLLRFIRQLMLSLVAGFALFALVFWSQLGQVGSLRLTALASAWLLVLVLDMLQRANPHPDDIAQAAPEARHAYAILILLAIGIVNTPLFVLFVPALVPGLMLARLRLPRWYWFLFLLVCVLGAAGYVARYLSSDWWLYPAAQAQQEGLVLPYLLADGWREAVRWLALLAIVRDQLTPLGGALALVGLARLSRWYPATGIVTMLAWASWAFFGLLYFGRDSDVLLLPLHMIGIAWMTVAVGAVGDWLQRSVMVQGQQLRWLVAALYFLLPVWLLLQRLTPA